MTPGEERGVHETSLRFEDTREVFLTWLAHSGESPTALFARYYRYWEEQPRVHLLRQNVLARLCCKDGQGQLHRFSEGAWPEECRQPGTPAPWHVVGIHAQALEGPRVRHLYLRDRIVGVVYEDTWARYCVMTGLQPENARLSRARQVDAVFDLAEEVLAGAGLAFTDVYRTWFFLDCIQIWYDEFTEARNAFFRSRGIFARPVPVSTEVGASNGRGTALVADLLAMQPKCAEASYRETTAGHPAAGAPFGRAIAFNLPGQCRLFVSGTADAGPDENPTLPNHAATLVERTLNGVEALLRSQGMGWRHMVRGLAYFQRREDVGTLDLWREAHRAGPWPVLVTQAELSRKDRLFELEVEAVRSG